MSSSEPKEKKLTLTYLCSVFESLETFETSQEKTGHTQGCLTSITVLKVTRERERETDCSWKIMLQTEVKNRVAQHYANY